MGNRTIDPELKARVMEMLAAGKPTKEINAETGVNPSTIALWKKGKKQVRSSRKTSAPAVSTDRLMHEIKLLRLEVKHVRGMLVMTDEDERRKAEVTFLQDKLSFYEDQLDPLPDAAL